MSVMANLAPVFKKDSGPPKALQKYPTKAEILNGGDSIICPNCLTELTGAAEDAATALYNDR